MSEEKNVPKLRFPGFTEPWEQRELGTVTQEFKSGNSLKADKISESGKYPVYGGNGLRGYTSNYNHDGEFALIGRQGALCGNMNYSIGKAYFTEHAVVVEANEKNNTRFIYYMLDTMNLGQYSDQSAQPGLAVNKLIKLENMFPRKEEQVWIGNYFQSLDHLITLHQRKLGHVKDLKKSMLQKMFPKNGELYPEVRFPGFTAAWEQRKLGEYVSITSGEAPSKFEVGTELYVKVDDLNYNDKYVVDTQNKVAEHSTVKRVTKGSVVFPKRGAAIMTNKVRIMGIDGYMDTNMMALTSEKLDSEFLYNIISKEGLYKIADTSTIPQINNKHVEPYEVTIPSLDEQRKIGAYFKQLDHLITLHQRELDHLQLLKKGMLQQMFV